LVVPVAVASDSDQCPETCSDRSALAVNVEQAVRDRERTTAAARRRRANGNMVRDLRSQEVDLGPRNFLRVRIAVRMDVYGNLPEPAN
jgi:hypothetical protein